MLSFQRNEYCFVFYLVNLFFLSRRRFIYFIYLFFAVVLKGRCSAVSQSLFFFQALIYYCESLAQPSLPLQKAACLALKCLQVNFCLLDFPMNNKRPSQKQKKTPTTRRFNNPTWIHNKKSIVLLNWLSRYYFTKMGGICCIQPNNIFGKEAVLWFILYDD